jgi:sensor domain CHASE-containing protein
MKLRLKTLIILVVIFIVLLSVLTTFIQSVVLSSYQNVEDQSVSRNIQRAVNGFSYEFDSLSKLSYDWSVWDDTYAFVEDRNQEFINTNLEGVSFQGIGVNIMMFYNTSYDLVFGKAVDLQDGNETPIPEAVLQELTQNDWLLHHNSTKSYVQGVILLPDAILLIASRPILTSAEEGPIHGTLIIGQYLTDKHIAEISDLIALPFTIARLDSTLPKDFETARLSITKDKPTFIQPLNKTVIAGYSLINDIHGNPVLILRVDRARDIFQQGTATIGYLIIFLSIITLIVCISIIIILEKLVTSPLTKLDKKLLEISASKDLSKRITVHGNDELAIFTKTTNILLDSLEKSQQKLHEKIQELEHYKTVTITREIKMIELKRKIGEASSKQKGGE